jgi:hypothetical protein
LIVPHFPEKPRDFGPWAFFVFYALLNWRTFLEFHGFSEFSKSAASGEANTFREFNTPAQNGEYIFANGAGAAIVNFRLSIMPGSVVILVKTRKPGKTSLVALAREGVCGRYFPEGKEAMRKKLFGLLTALLAGAGVAPAQEAYSGLYPAPPAAPGQQLYSGLYPAPPVSPAQQVYNGLYPGAPATTFQSGSESVPGTTQADAGAVPSIQDAAQYAQAQNPAQPLAPQTASTNPSTCAPSCQLCCPEPWKIKGWLGADFQVWFPPAMRLPPNLVTTGPVGTGAQLIGTSFGLPATFGFRIDTGMWTDPDERKGFQSITNSFFANTGTITITPTAGAPAFINNIGGPAVLSLPLTAGTVNTFAANSAFTDTDANSILRLINNPNTKVYALYGPKFASLEEDMTFTYNSLGAGFLDEFHTRNYFIGGQVGVWVKQNIGAFTADLQALCAIGYSYSNLIVLGKNTLGINTQVFTNDANIGYFGTNYFSVIPEVAGNLAYNLTQRIQLRVGYSFMAYVDVQRPSDQLVTNLGPGIVGPHTAPANPFTSTTYIIHGLNVGASWHY